MKFYAPFRSQDGSAYKAEAGRDGVTDDDMRLVKRIVKGSQKAMAKGNRLDTVSIDMVAEDGWQELDVAVIVEEQDECERLHAAIATLPLDQQQLIRRVYFQGVSRREIARSMGITEGAVRKHLTKIYDHLKNVLA